jgi:succinyl-diaminopimelate desuccinylase
MLSEKDRNRITKAVDEIKDEMVNFLQELIRIDTTVPPGRNYPQGADFIAGRLTKFGYEVQKIVVPEEYVKRCLLAFRGQDELTKPLPRVNVFGRMEGRNSHPNKHFTGHFDVVPPGEGWTVDPFGGDIRDGKIYGRGSTDQKSGIAASIYAVEALRRSGLKIQGTVEQSATIDEETGGFAGLGYLVEEKYVHKGKQDYVLYTECLDQDGICIGHRGAVFFDLRVKGKVGHGCMPHFAVNAIEKMTWVVQSIITELRPRIEARVSPTPIRPDGSKVSNILPIWIDAFAKERPAATVPPLCVSYWNRWFNPEENIIGVRAEIREFLDELQKRDPQLNIEYIEHFFVEPVLVPTENEFVRAYQSGVKQVIGHDSHFKLSPGFDDQRFVVLNGHIDKCIIYGPGVLNMAHLPDEYVPINDLVNAAKVMALSTAELLGIG